jgi:hypothetical protein
VNCSTGCVQNGKAFPFSQLHLVMALPASHSPPKGETPATDITPFWHRLNAFFLFPLQARPLAYAVFLSLCSLAVLVSPLIGFFAVVGILLATARYGFKVAAMASMGVLRAADFDTTPSDPEWVPLPWKFLGVMLVHGCVIALLTVGSGGLGTLGQLVSSLVMPATLMVLIQRCSLVSALNPAELFRAVTAVGLPYLLLCLFMMLLSMGTPMAWSLLAPRAPEGLVAPVLMFVIVYFSWVTASMLGYVMFQNHRNLDIDLVQEPHDALGASGQTRAESSAVRLDRQRDADVAEMVREGNIREAFELAYEWQRVNPDSLADQRRYHRVLLLTDKSDTLAHFTQRYVHQLLKENKGQEALQVHAVTLAKMPALVLESPNSTLALARLAWKAQDAPQAIALLKGFDKRYARHPTVPLAYELIARILYQGMGRTAQSLAILRAMQTQYPQHDSTQELAWLLRDHIAQPAG